MLLFHVIWGMTIKLSHLHRKQSYQLGYLMTYYLNLETFNSGGSVNNYKGQLPQISNV